MRKKKQVKSRKQQRKDSRIAKKAKKHEYFSTKKTRQQVQKKPLDNTAQYNKDEESKWKEKRASVLARLKTELKPGLSLQDEKLRELKQVAEHTKVLQEQMSKKRVKLLQEDAAADDIEIQRLEKQLGLKKRKEKSKANFFASDGLDYLLDVCDRSKLKDSVEAEKRFKEDDTDFGDDLAQVTGKKPVKKTPSVAKDDAGSSDLKKKAKNSKKAQSTVSTEGEKLEAESSDSEPEEMMSTKVGSKFPAKQKKKVDEKSDEASDGSLSDEEDLVDDDDPDSDGCFGLNDLDDGSAGSSIEGSDPDDDSDADDAEVKGTELAGEEIDVPAKKSRKSFNKNDKKGDLKIEKESLGQTNKLQAEEENDLIENPFSDDEVSTLSDDGNEDGKEAKDGDDEGMWEDIYGRKRDREGNVVAKYQPPQLRKQNAEGGQNQEKLLRLKKQMKGLINRLAENNMVSIASQIEVLYTNHSRNDMNETLWSLYSDALLGETDSPDRLVAEHAMLLTVLSANIGGEVSAHCLQRCVMLWNQLWTAGATVQDKRTNNVLLLLSYMYHFKLFHGTLLYDILDQLLGKLEEKEVELVLLVLRTVGFSLRKDDPTRLKDFVLKAQTLANNTSSAAGGTRIKFLLETVLAIKNNNMSKIPNYNPEYADHLKKSVKAYVRKGNYNAELKISLEDLLKADERGRWWVVGSAWTGELPGEKAGTEEDRKPARKANEGFSSKLLELAKKQRMNTDTRRTIFCILMSSEDYLDAFEKLLKLGLKGPSEREILNVLLHCLLQEKEFNPYYEHVARRFCVYNRRFQVMLQFATWDRIQDLKALSATQVTNLAKFLGNLIVEKNLAISVLKVVEFGELDKPAVRFIRQVLLAILLADSEDALLAAFGRIAASKALKLFREGLRLFLHHFVLRNSKDVEGTDMALLTTRVKLADSALSAADRNMAF